MMTTTQLIHLFKLETSSAETQSFERYPQLECKTYGFDCIFVASGEVEKIVKEFREHTLEEHGIEYPEGIIMKFLKHKFLNLKSISKQEITLTR